MAQGHLLIFTLHKMSSFLLLSIAYFDAMLCSLNSLTLTRYGWGCRIHRLHLWRGIRHPTKWPSRLGPQNISTASLKRSKTPPTSGPVGWDCRINRLHLCREVRLLQRVSWYDTKQSDGETSVMLELWGMRSTF